MRAAWRGLRGARRDAHFVWFEAAEELDEARRNAGVDLGGRAVVLARLAEERLQVVELEARVAPELADERGVVGREDPAHDTRRELLVELKQLREPFEYDASQLIDFLPPRTVAAAVAAAEREPEPNGLSLEEGQRLEAERERIGH